MRDRVPWEAGVRDALGLGWGMWAGTSWVPFHFNPRVFPAEAWSAPCWPRSSLFRSPLRYQSQRTCWTLLTPPSTSQPCVS